MGFTYIESIEKIHMFACTRFLGVPARTPNAMIYGELARYPLFVNSYRRCIKYWFRLLRMEYDRFPKQAYQILLLMDKNEEKCWTNDIKNILYRSGFYFVWLNQGVGYIKTFLTVFRQRLVDMFIQEWSSTIREQDRYMYRSLKSDFGTVNYSLDIDIIILLSSSLHSDKTWCVSHK